MHEYSLEREDIIRRRKNAFLKIWNQKQIIENQHNLNCQRATVWARDGDADVTAEARQSQRLITMVRIYDVGNLADLNFWNFPISILKQGEWKQEKTLKQGGEHVQCAYS